jgi:hypothetical protein
MAVLYDDNFGYWHVDDAEELAFFKYVQGQSVGRSCERCRSAVRLAPPKLLCAPCVSALECGAPLSMSEYGPSRRGTAGSRARPSAASSEPVPARAEETRSPTRPIKPRLSTVARLRRA